FSPGGIHTVSPGRISRTGPPHACTQPTPETTCSVWPSGCVCQVVRARGSKLTRVARIRAGAGASMIGSCHTVPVNESAGPRRVGLLPPGVISIRVSFHTWVSGSARRYDVAGPDASGLPGSTARRLWRRPARCATVAGLHRTADQRHQPGLARPDRVRRQPATRHQEADAGYDARPVLPRVSLDHAADVPRGG